MAAANTTSSDRPCPPEGAAKAGAAPTVSRTLSKTNTSDLSVLANMQACSSLMVPVSHFQCFFSVQLRSFMLLSIIVDFLPHKPEFDPKAFHVRFMMETVAVGQVFLSTWVFPCQLPFHQSSVIVHLSSISGIMGLLVAIVPRRSVLLRIRNENK